METCESPGFVRDCAATWPPYTPRSYSSCAGPNVTDTDTDLRYRLAHSARVSMQSILIILITVIHKYAARRKRPGMTGPTYLIAIKSTFVL